LCIHPQTLPPSLAPFLPSPTTTPVEGILIQKSNHFHQFSFTLSASSPL
jgi:hypothetical protein